MLNLKDVADRLSEHVRIRLTKYERAVWGMEADSRGMSLSGWIRDCVFLANLDSVGETNDASDK